MTWLTGHFALYLFLYCPLQYFLSVALTDSLDQPAQASPQMNTSYTSPVAVCSSAMFQSHIPCIWWYFFHLTYSGKVRCAFTT